MNSYEEKKQRRIDYYNEKAEKFEQQSSQLAHESSKMVEAIPLGQPLLVDHYSYKSDKNYRDRAWGKMEKSVEAGQKADKGSILRLEREYPRKASEEKAGAAGNS